MNDDRLTTALGSFYRGTAPTPPDPVLGLERVMTRVRKTRQRGRWWPLPAFDRPVSTFPSRELAPALIPATNGPTPARGFTMFSAVKFVAAAAIVALFGAFLLTGILTAPQGDEMAPAAVTESPLPTTTEELLSGMVTEEVEPGVLKITNDGVRDVGGESWGPDGGVTVGLDGSVWLYWQDGRYVQVGEDRAGDLMVPARRDGWKLVDDGWGDYVTHGVRSS